MELHFVNYYYFFYVCINAGSRGTEGTAASPGVLPQKKWGAGGAVLKNK